MTATLDQLRTGNSGAVLEIHGGRGIRQRLSSLGVHIGDTVRVVRSGSFGGPVLMEVHGMEVAVGKGMAEKIELEVQQEK